MKVLLATIMAFSVLLPINSNAQSLPIVSNLASKVASGRCTSVIFKKYSPSSSTFKIYDSLVFDELRVVVDGKNRYLDGDKIISYTTAAIFNQDIPNYKGSLIQAHLNLNSELRLDIIVYPDNGTPAVTFPVAISSVNLSCK